MSTFEAKRDITAEDGIRLFYGDTDLGVAEGRAYWEADEDGPYVQSFVFGTAPFVRTISHTMNDATWRACFRQIAAQLDSCQHIQEWLQDEWQDTCHDDGVSIANPYQEAA